VRGEGIGAGVRGSGGVVLLEDSKKGERLIATKSQDGEKEGREKPEPRGGAKEGGAQQGGGNKTRTFSGEKKVLGTKK